MVLTQSKRSWGDDLSDEWVHKKDKWRFSPWIATFPRFAILTMPADYEYERMQPHHVSTATSSEEIAYWYDNGTLDGFNQRSSPNRTMKDWVRKRLSEVEPVSFPVYYPFEPPSNDFFLHYLSSGKIKLEVPGSYSQLRANANPFAPDPLYFRANSDFITLGHNIPPADDEYRPVSPTRSRPTGTPDFLLERGMAWLLTDSRDRQDCATVLMEASFQYEVSSIMPPHCECGSQHQYFKTQFRDITQVPKAPMGENIIHAYNANWSAAGEQYWSYLYKIEYAHNWVCEFCDQEIHGNLGQGIDIF